MPARQALGRTTFERKALLWTCTQQCLKRFLLYKVRNTVQFVLDVGQRSNFFFGFLQI